MANVFNALFAFRQRDKNMPEENFLTAAFVHLLEASPSLLASWAAQVLGVPVVPESVGTNIQAGRMTPEGGRAIPDVEIVGETRDGRRFVVWHEHKWRSPTDRDQLQRYRQTLRPSAPLTALIFVAASAQQTADARDLCEQSWTWSQISNFLGAHFPNDAHGDELVRQFQSFLDDQGLGVQEPLSPGKLAAYCVGQGVESDCARLVEQLATRDWSPVPAWLFTTKQATFQRKRWGRVGIEIGDWKPVLFLGVLLDHADHGWPPIDKMDRVELFLTIDFSPPTFDLLNSPLNDVAHDLREKFLGTQIGGPADHRKGGWRQLTMRQPLSRVIAGKRDEMAQVEAIYERLAEWSAALFGDPRTATVLGRHFNKTDAVVASAPTELLPEAT